MDNLFSVAERFGTPCFVFDEVQLARRMKAVRAIVPEDIRLCYSIKANPFLIPAMRRLVGTLEVCSPGELEICRQQGISPDMVLFSGVNKTMADVERAMDLGVTRFTCAAPLHVRLIDEAARARGRVYPVLLRLTAGSQFGMDERDFFAALDHRAAHEEHADDEQRKEDRDDGAERGSPVTEEVTDCLFEGVAHVSWCHSCRNLPSPGRG